MRKKKREGGEKKEKGGWDRSSNFVGLTFRADSRIEKSIDAKNAEWIGGYRIMCRPTVHATHNRPLLEIVIHSGSSFL